MDLVAVTKNVQAVVALAQLKFASDDYQMNLCKAFGNVLKTCVTCSNLSKKYEATGENAGKRLAKDTENKMLSRLGATITSFLEACEAFKDAKNDPQAGPGDSPLLGLAASQIFSETEAAALFAVFFDSVGLQSSNLEKLMKRCGENAQKLICGYDQGGENFWRKDVAQDATLADIKSSAKGSLKKVDGAQLKGAVESLQEDPTWVRARKSVALH